MPRISSTAQNAGCWGMPTGTLCPIRPSRVRRHRGSSGVTRPSTRHSGYRSERPTRSADGGIPRIRSSDRMAWAVDVWTESSGSDADLGGLGGSQDAFEAAQAEVVCGGQSSGSRSRTVGVDDGKALRLVEAIEYAP